jgi:hypothetical protein
MKNLELSICAGDVAGDAAYNPALTLLVLAVPKANANTAAVFVGKLDTSGL